MRDKTNNLLKDVKKVLEENILKFDLRARESREATVDAGILWAFSAAFNTFRKKDYLIEATKNKDFFIERFLDHKHGGVYKSLDKKGERLDTSKDLKAQAFAIYALSEFYAATGDDEALKGAKNIFKIVEKEFVNGEGGYAYSLNRDFSPLEPIADLESYLTLLEAYANLYKVSPDEACGKKTEALLALLCEKSEKLSGNVAVEAAWKMLDAAFILRDIDLVNKIREKAIKIASEHEKDSSSYAENLLCKLWLWKYCGIPLEAEKVIEGWGKLKENITNSLSGHFHAARTCLGVLELL